MLVVSLYPARWKNRLMHLEIRYRISVGYLEGISAELVRVESGSAKDWGLDSFELERKGEPFLEEIAGRGAVFVAAMNVRAKRGAINAAFGRGLDFGDPSIGRADFSYFVRGVKAGF